MIYKNKILLKLKNMEFYIEDGNEEDGPDILIGEIDKRRIFVMTADYSRSFFKGEKPELLFLSGTKFEITHDTYLIFHLGGFRWYPAGWSIMCPEENFHIDLTDAEALKLFQVFHKHYLKH